MDDESKRWRLAGMMALLYAVQGAFWPMLAVHLQDLGISGRGRGWIFATLAIAAMATPLGAGHIADRLMPTQRLLALVYALGTCLMAVLASGPSNEAGVLFALFLAYWLLTAPTYGLANSLAFRNLSRPAEQFGGVRLWGTIGWMAIGWIVTMAMNLHGGMNRAGHGAYEAFVVAAVVSAVFALYCLTLPHTPPLVTGARRGLDLRSAAELVRRPSIGFLLFTAFGVSLTTPFVYQVVPTYLRSAGLPRPWLASAMTLSQVPEIISLAAMPAVLRRLGYRGTLALGIAAWVVYYLNLAAGPPLWLALLNLPLNGVAFACFIVAGQMYIDSQAPTERRASAQALHVVVTSGLGCFLGNLLVGELMAQQGRAGSAVFAVPLVIDSTMLLVLLGRFRPAASTPFSEPAAVVRGNKPASRLARLPFA